ncbi:putative UDP-glucose 6-dehydrogenase [Pseudomonas sp. GM49]|nr:putative UDP-glucose 6-dehydrogenase [Pseudomonas sp. GM49]
MDVSVFGTGYVGLIQAVALADVGHRVLLHTGEHAAMPLKLLRSVTEVNDHQRHILFSKLKAQFPGGLAGKSIAVWGLAFKPDTNDMREAPSRYLMEALWAEGASVQAYDPQALSECRRLYGYRDDLHYSGIGLRHIVPEAVRP